MSPKAFENWSQNVYCKPHDWACPTNVEEIATAVRECAEAGRNMRVIGSGHSFTELVKTDGVILSLDNFQGLEDVDKSAKTAVVRAGTKLFRLNALLDEQGLMMENLGDINKQSIAGAVSTGTHGTGISWRNISSQACALTLVTASGEVMEISEDKDLFKAAQISLGSLGVIAKAKLRLMDSYKLKYVRKRIGLEECLNNVKSLRENNRHFEAFWFPYTDVVQIKELNITDEAPDDKAVKKFFMDVVLETAFFGLSCYFAYFFPHMSARTCRFIGRFISGSTEINRAHKVFSTTRMIKFNEMEYSIPADAAPEVMREINKWINKHNPAVTFPLELRYVKADDAWLSPHYGHDSATISVHSLVGMEYEEYFNGLEEIFRAHNGRPHWGKLHSLTAKELAPLYPMWNKFHETRKKLDPKGLFMSPYLKKLFEV